MLKYSQSIVYCSNEDTSLNDFYIMTLSTGDDEEELLSSENLEESHFSSDMENEEESQEEQDGNMKH